jgi:uncharacterized protein YndB with AHSA1/START domain
MNANDTIVETPADAPVIRMRRRFAAPRELVFRCYTDPARLAHFWGPRNATTRTTITALAPGGVWVTRWTYPDGKSWGYSSVYLEISPPARIVYRDCPEGWAGGLEGLPPVTLHTVIGLTDLDETTDVLVTVTCPSIAERDENVRRGFAGMVATGNDRLAEYLKQLQES